MKNPFRHNCKFVPVAARPGFTMTARSMMGLGPPIDETGTLVLYRCACGAIQADLIRGVWTGAELQLPTGDAEAIEKLLRSNP